MEIEKMLDSGELPKDLDIYKSFLTTRKKFEESKNILCSVSGGADSDLMVDMFCRFDKDKVRFVFFDTGLEYNATKEHLNYLEEKYKIEIERVRPEKPIPLACREFGQPFLSKQVSEFIQRLQKHGFQWENDSYSNLIQKYPKCSSALKWWCDEKGAGSMFSIRNNKHLKEFMTENPQTFRISNKCCQHSKKLPLTRYKKGKGFDLDCSGVRKYEGGVRGVAYKSCFTDNSNKDNEINTYRPLFWYKNETKEAYEKFFGITHSKCYSEYKLKRTGCAGCPFAKGFEEELKVLETFEPKLFKAVNNIFKD